MSADHFARIRPIVGDHLQQARVAAIGQISELLTLLAASGIRHWLLADHPNLTATLHAIAARHGQALSLNATVADRQAWFGTCQAQPPDLLIACGDAQLQQQAAELAQQIQRPLLLVTPPSGVRACVADVWLPTDGALPPPIAADPQEQPFGLAYWEWHTALPLVAALARSILLRQTPVARADLAALWAGGRRRVQIGGEHPFDISWTSTHEPLAPAPALRYFRTPHTRQGSLLIAGLGSIGSEAAALLAPATKRLVLADPDRVDHFNPVRQYFRQQDLDHYKAQALANQFDHAIPYTGALDQDRSADLLAQHPVQAALIATGTTADFGIARALRERGIPHVVARCYPRARYWEAIVDAGDGGPGLEDVRGYMQLGPLPSPTPEQRAAYSDQGALEAEPATLIESGWAAAWAARLAFQLLCPVGLRERWLLDLIGNRQICLVGGAVVEPTPQGPAYAIDLPGQIHAWTPPA
ncbi:MAG: hypothetical protein Fur005_33470 [Roseiflexaceae bacterium]